MPSHLPMTEEELAALEREVENFRSLDQDAAEIAIAEIRRAWSEISDLRDSGGARAAG